MEFCCCICGSALALVDSSQFPQWCKDIRALFWFNNQPTLSDVGYVDDAAIPFSLPIPQHGHQRLYYQSSLIVEKDEMVDFCFPFHAGCWTLLQESCGRELVHADIKALFDIFRSIHCRRRSLEWGHDYYVHDVSDGYSAQERPKRSRDVTTSWHKQPALLSDPTSTPQPDSSCPTKYQATKCQTINFDDLPPEILQLILCGVDFRDVQSLFVACPIIYWKYGNDASNLPPQFWESRFWPYNESGFARFNYPPSYSWIGLFFVVKSALKKGPIRLNLMNRRRIWKLGTNISRLLDTIRDPSRRLHGTDIAIPNQLRGFNASCLALKDDNQGCRELKQIYVPFDGAQLCALRPTFVSVSTQKSISGLTFKFDSGCSISAGYIMSGGKCQDDLPVSSRYLWMRINRMGFVNVTLGGNPEFRQVVSTTNEEFGVTCWPLLNIEGIYVGLDAMRIVRICATGPKPEGAYGIMWAHYPLSTPFIYEDDITALRDLQQESFTPASILSLKQGEQLFAIIVYSALGNEAGITGLRFIYNTGYESLWGSDSDVASLAFFLNREQLVKVTSYKIGSLVIHLQFITNLGRTSDLFPQLLTQSTKLQRIDYIVSEGEYIRGFCGCFTGFSKQLNCFGVLSETTTVKIIPLCPTPWVPEITPPETLLGGLRNHGEHRSRLPLEDTYQSIQASVTEVISKCRRAGQVTGLLFRPRNNESYPILLGQWSGPGKIHDLGEGEHVIDLEITRTRTLDQQVQTARFGLSQVKSLTLFTSIRSLSWGPEIAGVCRLEPLGLCKPKLTEVTWIFNAVFDHVQCFYK